MGTCMYVCMNEVWESTSTSIGAALRGLGGPRGLRGLRVAPVGLVLRRGPGRSSKAQGAQVPTVDSCMYVVYVYIYIFICTCVAYIYI